MLGARGAWAGRGAARVSGRGGAALLLALLLHAPRPDALAAVEHEATGAVRELPTNSTRLLPGQERHAYLQHCPPTSAPCSTLLHPCVACVASPRCRYGQTVLYSCRALGKVQCEGSRTFNRTALCRFCYQTEKWEHRCIERANCNSVASPLRYYTTNCTVSGWVECLGRREFQMRLACAWSGGTRWGTALLLALTLGGFGADRFYLGHWQEGIGKLFSFGGLGVWTLVDALLIGVHHLGPADGSLYL